MLAGYASNATNASTDAMTVVTIIAIIAGKRANEEKRRMRATKQRSFLFLPPALFLSAHFFPLFLGSTAAHSLHAPRSALTALLSLLCLDSPLARLPFLMADNINFFANFGKRLLEPHYFLLILNNFILHILQN